MATDRETKALLKALVDGQVKLAEGQAQLTERVDHLAGRLDTFAEKITADITRLTGRLDAFAEVVVRGFTESAGRDIATDKRVDGLEARVAKLEQRELTTIAGKPLGPQFGGDYGRTRRASASRNS
jgi:hypothetical protein